MQLNSAHNNEYCKGLLKGFNEKLRSNKVNKVDES